MSGDRVTLAADQAGQTTAEYLRNIYDRMRELDGYQKPARRPADEPPDHIYDNDHQGAGAARTPLRVRPADDDRLIGDLLDTEGAK